MIRVCFYILILVLLYIVLKRVRNTHDQSTFIKFSRVILCVYLVLGFYYTIGSRLLIQPIDVLKRVVFSLGSYNNKPQGDFSTVENIINEAYLFVKDENSRWYALPAILLNILLFFPLGLLIPASYISMKTLFVVFLGFSISVIIELSQLLFSLGTPDLLDVICNTLGVFLGIMAFKHINHCLQNEVDGQK